MRINAITSVNNPYRLQKRLESPKNNTPVEPNNPSFKSMKGASLGAAVGYILGGVAAVTVGMPLLLTAGAAVVAGALAGDGIEEGQKELDRINKEEEERNKNKNNK